jgi:hypothetical protein
VIIRFGGDSDHLIERFERPRQRWIDRQQGGYDRPAFYEACKTDEGIAIVTAWESALAHRAFAHPIAPHLEAVGMPMPDQIERLRIAQVDQPTVDRHGDHNRHRQRERQYASEHRRVQPSLHRAGHDHHHEVVNDLHTRDRERVGGQRDRDHRARGKPARNSRKLVGV